MKIGIMSHGGISTHIFMQALQKQVTDGQFEFMIFTRDQIEKLPQDIKIALIEPQVDWFGVSNIVQLEIPLEAYAPDGAREMIARLQEAMYELESE